MSRPEKLKNQEVSEYNSGFNACHDAHTEWLQSEEAKEMVKKTLKERRYNMISEKELATAILTALAGKDTATLKNMGVEG